MPDLSLGLWEIEADAYKPIHTSNGDTNWPTLMAYLSRWDALDDPAFRRGLRTLAEDRDDIEVEIL